MADVIFTSAGALAQTAPVVSEIAWFALVAYACRYLKNRRAATLVGVGIASFIAGWAARLADEYSGLPVLMALVSDLAIGLSLIMMLVSVAYLVREGWRAAHTLKCEAERDELTGVYNRRYFLRFLEQMAENGKQEFAVAIVDIDNMKEVNDNFGHDKGDELLQRTARTLREGLRQSDVVARLGGDEFGIIFRNAGNDSQVLLRRLRRQLDAGGIAASFGLACCPRDGSEAKKLMAVADARMYRQKKARKRRAAQGEHGSEEEGSAFFPAARLAK
jgi:diguanylate cyclase (GGDEF)-like protein